MCLCVQGSSSSGAAALSGPANNPAAASGSSPAQQAQTSQLPVSTHAHSSLASAVLTRVSFLQVTTLADVIKLVHQGNFSHAVNVVAIVCEISLPEKDKNSSRGKQQRIQYVRRLRLFDGSLAGSVEVMLCYGNRKEAKDIAVGKIFMAVGVTVSPLPESHLRVPRGARVFVSPDTACPIPGGDVYLKPLLVRATQAKLKGWTLAAATAMSPVRVLGQASNQSLIDFCEHTRDGPRRVTRRLTGEGTIEDIIPGHRNGNVEDVNCGTCLSTYCPGITGNVPADHAYVPSTLTWVTFTVDVDGYKYNLHCFDPCKYCAFPLCLFACVVVGVLVFSI